MIPNYTRPKFNPQPKPERSLPKERKPLRKQSLKKQQEIKEGKGEAEFFKKIWEERPHRCTECNDRILVPEPGNFHHKKPKGKYPELKLDPGNIVILCRGCHHETHFRANKAKKKI